MKPIRLLLAIAFLGLFLPVTIGGTQGGSQSEAPVKILVVCPEGPPVCPFSKVEEAIQAARPDDLIFLRPGTYQETLIIEKSVRLVATEVGQVRIQGIQLDQPTITLKTQGNLHVTLGGVIIIHGISVSNESTGSLNFALVDSQVTQSEVGFDCPWTLHSQGSARLSVLNSRFSENTVGMNLDGCDFRGVSVSLSQATFTGNVSAVFITQTGRGPFIVDVEESRFVANGGGLTAHLSVNDSKLSVRNSWFVSNLGGFYSYNGTIEIRASHFISNRIGLQLGHLVAQLEGVILLEDSVIADNVERGLYVASSGQIEVRNSQIQGNGTGIMVFRADGDPLWLENNRILRNREWGVAIFRSPCVENPPSDLRFIWPIYIQGKNNEIQENGKGNLCPPDYNWPPNFRKP